MLSLTLDSSMLYGCSLTSLAIFWVDKYEPTVIYVFVLLILDFVGELSFDVMVIPTACACNS